MENNELDFWCETLSSCEIDIVYTSLKSWCRVRIKYIALNSYRSYLFQFPIWCAHILYLSSVYLTYVGEHLLSSFSPNAVEWLELEDTIAHQKVIFEALFFQSWRREITRLSVHPFFLISSTSDTWSSEE